MFSIKGRPSNEKLILNAQGIAAPMKQGVTQAFYSIGKDLRKDASQRIRSKNKTGRVYVRRVGGRVILHRASAPGEYPANMTGKLNRSLKYKVIGDNKLQFGVSDNIIYGKFLELGTVKMAPRPYLLPTIKRNFNKMQSHFNYQINQKIKVGI